METFPNPGDNYRPAELTPDPEIAAQLREMTLRKFVQACVQMENNPFALRSFVATWGKSVLRDTTVPQPTPAPAGRVG